MVKFISQLLESQLAVTAYVRKCRISILKNMPCIENWASTDQLHVGSTRQDACLKLMDIAIHTFPERSAFLPFLDENVRPQLVLYSTATAISPSAEIVLLTAKR
ncbi:hypothetical protein M514_03692 [Trichuris suis]|uniref:Uncharacterized protein n=1 Tax=Trichuris suis TaxID=68888 RepID=A0A085MDQ6_9BILA|nr:hypothetical protein M513_03692 [Trichuris suis]KFD68676.1 hypothetical protein M514_03692 [Trichuris suis]